MTMDDLFRLPVEDREAHSTTVPAEISAEEWQMVCRIASGHDDDDIKRGRLFLDRTPDGIAVAAQDAAFRRAEELGVGNVIVIV